jgi:hypothetical protein
MESKYWIDLAQDRDKWQALVNVAMNVQVVLPQPDCLKCWSQNA